MLKRLSTITIVLVSLLALTLAPAAAQDDTDTDDYAYLRITHLAYEEGGLDVYIDGQPSDIQAVQFGDISGWVEVTPGVYSIAFVPVGSDFDATVLGPYNYELEEDGWTTLAVTGAAEDATLGVQPLRMDYSDINQGDARIAVFHAITNAPPVDLVLDDGTVLVEDLPYVKNADAGFEAGMATFNVAAGTYSINIVPTGETEPVLLSLDEIDFEAGTFYFVAAAGSPDEPVPVLSSIAIDELNEMTNASIGEDDDMDDDMDDVDDMDDESDDADDDMDDADDMDDESDDADDDMDDADDMDDESDDADDDMDDADDMDDESDDADDDMDDESDDADDDMDDADDMDDESDDADDESDDMSDDS